MASERVQVPIEKSKYAVLAEIARRENIPMSQIVSRLVNTAMELAEDMALVQLAEQRMATFSRDDSFSSSDLLKWNKNRKKK